LAIAVIGGILISMVLSLIITPAIEYYLTHNKEAAVSEGTPVAVR
jgi:multidrug efflux pump subunit AcrB